MLGCGPASLIRRCPRKSSSRHPVVGWSIVDGQGEETGMSETTSGGADGQVRWGILGAASIARGQFLPGLRETGDGRAVIVGSRNRERGEAFAAAEGVDRVTDSYEAVLAAEIDAVYITL